MKGIRLSLIAMLAVSGAIAGGDIGAPLKAETVPAEVEKDWGKVFGQERTFYIDRTYSGSVNNNRSSLNTGGYIGYETPKFKGLTLAAAVYGTYGFNIHSEPADVVGAASYDPSLYGGDFDNYAFIGQAYLNYDIEKTNIKIGRMRLDTPMAGADDARMLPNLFEAAVLSNTSIEGTTLLAAQVTRETVGTFGNVYGLPTTPSNAALMIESGYGLGYKLGTSGNFVNMGTIALGDVDAEGNYVDNSTDGVTALAAIYSGIEGLKLQAWDYVAWDILNAVYLEADYGWNCRLMDEVKMKASAQYIHEGNIGSALAGDVKSDYFAVKLASTYQNLSGYIAYSTTGDNTGDALNGGIITPWGGMPAYTQGMVTRHMFFADTNTWKVAAEYDLKDILANVKVSAYYAHFDIGADNAYVPGTAWTAKEPGFDIIYEPESIKGLNLRFRGNFPTDFKPGLDWNEYRLIANYTF